MSRLDILLPIAGIRDLGFLLCGLVMNAASHAKSRLLPSCDRSGPQPLPLSQLQFACRSCRATAPFVGDPVSVFVSVRSAAAGAVDLGASFGAGRPAAGSCNQHRMEAAQAHPGHIQVDANRGRGERAVAARLPGSDQSVPGFSFANEVGTTPGYPCMGASFRMIVTSGPMAMVSGETDVTLPTAVADAWTPISWPRPGPPTPVPPELPDVPEPLRISGACLAKSGRSPVVMALAVIPVGMPWSCTDRSLSGLQPSRKSE